MRKISNLTLLFVEDERDIRERYCQILAQKFDNIYQASNGEEAYTVFCNKRPNILIVDINMPKIDGLEFVKKIRTIDKNCKVIILTAHTKVEYLLKATELNLTKYLVKPVNRRELNEAIDLAMCELGLFEVHNKKILNLKDGYIWNFTRKCLFLNNKEVMLTKKEKEILNNIFLNPSIELTYDALISSVWDDYTSDHKDTLKTMVANLRKKLPKDTIQTVYGIGYLFSI